MTKDEWSKAYAEAGSASELGRRIGKSKATVCYHLRKHGIDIKTTGFKAPKTVRRFGPDHHNWKGGTYLHEEGYVMQYAPEQADAGKYKGYVLQHRLVMERHLGRPLLPHEIVHHRNEVKDDNRIENLELTDRSEHMQGHKSDVVRERGRFTAIRREGF